MSWRSRRLRWVLVLVLACGAVYGRALGYGFVAYDDDLYVYDNAMVLRGLSWESTRWAFEGPHIGHYHPLTWLSHLTDVSLFGLDARGHHATSLAWHAVNSVLLSCSSTAPRAASIAPEWPLSCSPSTRSTSSRSYGFRVARIS